MMIVAWGEGVNVCLVPPPPRRIACCPPKARVKTLAEAWIPKENIFYAVGARVMDVSMVIAAWGEGVGLSLSPSPSSDCSSLAKTRIKNWLGSSDAPPFAACIPAPTPHLIRKKRTEKLWRTSL
jgi:hypothetical protein